MSKIIVISTTHDSDAYSNQLAKYFAKGIKTTGHEVEIISLAGKTLEQACEIGKRMFTSPQAPSRPKTTPARPQPVIKTDVRIQKMVLAMGDKILPRRQIVAELGLKQGSRPCFINNYLKPTLSQGYIEFAYPNCPHKPEQAYKLTLKGLDLYDQLTQKKD